MKTSHSPYPRHRWSSRWLCESQRSFLLMVVLGFMLTLQSSLPWANVMAQSTTPQLVENFNGLTPGALNGQNGWTATAGASVVSDPANPANQVIQLAGADQNVYLPLPLNGFTPASEWTLHFRMRRTGVVDAFAGASDEAAPNGWSSFEAQVGAADNRPGRFMAIDGPGGLNYLADSFERNEWYCISLIIEAGPSSLSANSYYIAGRGGVTNFFNDEGFSYNFRNGAATLLQTFLARTGNDRGGSLLLDDIYLIPEYSTAGVPNAECVRQSPAPTANFQKVDDFEGLAVGDINGQNSWTASPGLQVSADPVDAANKVLKVAGAERRAYKAFPIPITRAGTLYFRLLYSGQHDGWAGASDVTAPLDFPAFETQLRLTDLITARNGSLPESTHSRFNLPPNQWHCFWMVINNDVDEYYYEALGGPYEALTGGFGDFPYAFRFRNSTSSLSNNPLQTFFTRVADDLGGALYIDDIYLDPNDLNLAMPGRGCTANVAPTSMPTATSAQPTTTPASPTATATNSASTPTPTGSPSPSAGFQKVEDFETLTINTIVGQNGWEGTGDASVAVDPLQAANQALRIRAEAEYAFKALPAAINSTATGTLYFRIMRSNALDAFAGLSDDVAPGDWPSFEAQIGSQNLAPTEWRVRNGAAFQTVSTSYAQDRWYCTWLVINNQTDSYELYLQGGDYGQQSRVGGTFSLRNGGSEPLRTFLAKVGTPTSGYIYIDDIFMDPVGRNLGNPGGSCAPDGTSTPTPTPSATPLVSGFELLDDFDASSPGSLHGLNGWSAPNVRVSADPLNANNLTLQLSGENQYAHHALPTAVANGTTGTLFFRLLRDGPVDAFAGGSDEAAPQEWSAFETQVGAADDDPGGWRAINGAPPVDHTSSRFTTNSWYCVWTVINAASDSYEVYLKGGQYAEPTHLSADGQTSFAFRNGEATTSVGAFFARMGHELGSSLYIDDIYIHAGGKNLAQPGGICTTGDHVNQPPQAQDDTGIALLNTRLDGASVLANDTDADGDLLTAETVPVSVPSHGTLILRADGSYVYTPTTGYTGEDTFVYRVVDGNGGVATATVRLTVVQTNVDLSPNLAVKQIEFTQAIQTEQNDVPLVARRATIGRLYLTVENAATRLPNVTALLHATRNGQPLPGSPLAPVNSGSQIAAPAVAERHQLDDTLNFQLPDEWLAPGQITVWAEVNPNATVEESNRLDNRSADFTLNFIDVAPLQVVLVPIAYQQNGSGPVYRPRLTNVNNLGLGMLRDIYPVGHIETTIHAEYIYRGNLATYAGWEQLLEEIYRLRQQEMATQPGQLRGAAAMPKYYGLVPMGVPGETVDPAGGKGRVHAALGGLGYLSDPVGIGLVDQEDVAAHEIGHNLGLLHVESSTCRQSPTHLDPLYPYDNAGIGNVGMNPHAYYLIPSRHFDVMSYCWPKWISDYHYLKLLNALPRASAQAQIAQAQAVQAQLATLLVSGSIFRNGATGQLNYALPALAGTVASGGAGDYSVKLLDANGVAQVSYAFEPSRVVTETVPGLVSSERSDFAFHLPPISDLSEIQLWQGSTLIDSLAAAAPPQLSATFTVDPQNPNLLHLSWSMPEGTDALINLRYSKDNGASWQLLVQGLQSFGFDLDTSKLPGSANALLEVVASGPTASSTVQLAIGPVSNKVPLAAILSDDTVYLSPGEPLLLFGAGVDYEDGALTASSLVWKDQAGNVLATGNALLIAQGLEVGTYTITLTVTDGVGVTSTASVKVVVEPDTVRGEAGATIYLPVALR